METKVSTKHEEYAYPTLSELKKQTAEVMRDFHPRKADPLCTFSKKEYFEDIFKINVKKIYKWKSCSDQEERRPALKDVLFLSILASLTRQEARYYMAVAGYPYVEYPSNHKKFDRVLATCFDVIDAVYTKYEPKSKPDDNNSNEISDNNGLRKKRLDEARQQIFTLDNVLANKWIPPE